MSKWIVESSFVYEVTTDDIKKSLETMEFPSFPSADDVEFGGNSNTANEISAGVYRVFSMFTFTVDTNDIEEAINEMEFCDYQYGKAEYIEGSNDYYEQEKAA